MEKKRTNSLAISLALSIVVIIGIVVGIFIYKRSFKNSSNQKPIENNNQPSKTSPPSTDFPVPSKEIELEKYLLEKRLDLKKYFVFNLGKEVKTKQQKNINVRNQRWITESLANDLTKLTASYEKKMEEKGYGIIIGKVEGYEGWRSPKEAISFVDENYNIDKEWCDDKLDKKIARKQNEEKNIYVVFEKDNEFWKTFFRPIFVDKQGKQWFAYHGSLLLRIGAVAISDYVYLFWGKKPTLDFLKENDPELIEKVFK